MNCLSLVIFLVSLNYLRVHCESTDPKTEVELLPEAVSKERKKVKIFWAIMHEVCRTFCIWKKVCDPFCDIFDLEGDNDDSDFDTDFLHADRSSRQSMWLFTSVTKVCERDINCVENCLKMELDQEDYEEDPIHSAETAEGVFKTLFQIARKFLTKCAHTNGKPIGNVYMVTGDEFCREITLGRVEFTELCVNSLT